MIKKTDVEQQIVALEASKAKRHEPLRNWILEANQAQNAVISNNWLELKSFLQKVGSNRLLRAKTLRKYVFNATGVLAGATAQFHQKCKDSFPSRKIRFQKLALGGSLGLLQTIILTCCLIQTAAATEGNVTTNPGAIVADGGAVVAVKFDDVSVLNVAQLRQQNVYLRAELAATLRRIGTNAEPVSEPHGEQSQKDGRIEWHWLCVILLISLFVGNQLGRTKNSEKKTLQTLKNQQKTHLK